MRYKPSICILILFSLLSSCNQLDNIRAKEKLTAFEGTFRQYAKHLRWGHFSDVTQFMTQKHAQAAYSSIDSLKGIRITSVKPTRWIFNEANNEAVGHVNVDYYITNSGIIKQTEQQQKWIWSNNSWKLDAGLPNIH